MFESCGDEAHTRKNTFMASICFQNFDITLLENQMGGKSFYIYLWAFTLCFSIFMMTIVPVVIMPLFNKHAALVSRKGLNIRASPEEERFQFGAGSAQFSTMRYRVPGGIKWPLGARENCGSARKGFVRAVSKRESPSRADLR